MQTVPIPLQAGISIDGAPDARIEYPTNLVPCPAQDGVGDMYLRQAEGIDAFAVGQGFDRGAILWTGTGNDEHYRVSGTKLIRVNGAGVAPTIIGDVGGTGPVHMDFSFDRIGFVSNGVLNYWDDIVLTTVTDPNMPANLIDAIWLDGYWVATDGTLIAVTDLANPAVVNATKFDTTDRPDPVQRLLKGVNELTVVSRNYIDTFQNVGGTGFPFQRIKTAVVTKGSVGRYSACVFNDTIAFVGSGRDEACCVYLAKNSQLIKISSTEIDRILGEYTTAQLETITMQAIALRGGQYLHINLPDRTLVYDAIMSQKMEQPVWHKRVSSLVGDAQYKAQNIVLVDDQWVCGDPASTAIGVFSFTTSEHFGAVVRWQFDTTLLRNDVNGAVIHCLFLFALTGVVAQGINPRVWSCYTEDGENYSMPRYAPSGSQGKKGLKIMWLRNGIFENFRIYRFGGDSTSRLSIMALNAHISPLKA